ncbi:hypothetical protein DOTSEDRAFT_69069 [Dothistroma septosporum NZE10]|uniref:Uncharacterized protein n=1 Tax=Dothistroma septosporum (strain NZE10 / CBS 128990) TaxID=675120 RepID=N1Q5E5_DOTSN|nr:hypothetical protein DOTSEDRAFT_69069 [Dothistroma septosporum NZE10]
MIVVAARICYDDGLLHRIKWSHCKGLTRTALQSPASCDRLAFHASKTPAIVHRCCVMAASQRRHLTVASPRKFLPPEVGA